MFLASTKSWTQLKPLLAPRYCHASINVNKKILVIGGHVSGDWSASVHSLELDGGEWTEEPDLPDSPVHVHPEVARVNNDVFVLDSYSNDLYKQDVGSKVWSRKAKCPGESCRGARMTSARGRLYLIGGKQKIFRCYNPDTDTWTEGKAPALKHYYGALLFCEEKLHLIGGQNEDRAEEYDFTTESWSVCAFRVPKKLENLYAVALDM
jgi:N-acetylneuraminic acid mutarotase